ncbi:Zn-dependent hydrolase [Shouchella hunanensis]|uniref:Zn-dependent hydrolase n=1 Tax=Shouchella hunanensis TaxID=766894 RepID=A0ABY7W484_9BACI|nr:Zn-dependent hydrolase [Shouchella hunanensis]WDF03396.1 Zn-dependent hydrolase [Shouchella hunanensis]
MKTGNLRINRDRLMNTLRDFAKIGETKNKGVTRLALSKEDIQARTYFKDQCEALGLSVQWDDLGNMYALLSGKNPDQPPIYMGSHLDTVKKGGRFDGVLGVAAGLEVIRVILDQGVELNRPVGIINFTNEEGARFEPSMMASGIVAGKFDVSTMIKKIDQSGVTFGDALELSGFKGSRAHRLNQAAAFLELHIEQGPILEQLQLDIGVVECVVGMCCYEIEITGQSNHAGTTPQSLRKDALTAANYCMNILHDRLAQLDSDLVYTIGRFSVSPNIHTVIPNKVVFSIEARHKDEAVVEQVEAILTDITNESPLPSKATKLWGRHTVWFDEEIVEQVEESTKALHYSYKRMVSGAGHDAQFIAGIIPTAMIFVPSAGGISHAENEYTSWEACANGASVLLETIYKLTNKL